MANNGSLKLGWAEVSITPEGRRIMLEGQFYDRISQYVETPITATALAIESDGEQAVIISADLTHVTADLVAMVRAELKDKAPGFDPMKLIVGATHTHTSFVYQTSNDLNLHALEDYLGVENARTRVEWVSAAEGQRFVDVMNSFVAEVTALK